MGAFVHLSVQKDIAVLFFMIMLINLRHSFFHIFQSVPSVGTVSVGDVMHVVPSIGYLKNSITQTQKLN